MLLVELSWSLENLPVCVALQETLLKPSCTSNIRGYSILRKDCNTGERACGGLALLINHTTPFSPILIRTSLQAVAVLVSIFSTVTICNVYLPPNASLYFRELQELIDQRLSPFILLGDFNAHHLLWGCQDVNSRGKVVEKLLTELDLTLLNDGSNTYFHSPTQSFSAIDLSICSPSLLLYLTWSVLGNPLGSDHFPAVISYATPIACATLRQPRWKFDQADWETFRTQADITEDMVSSGSIDEAVSLVTSCILSAANNAISQPSSRLPRFPKPWWNEECQMAKKDQNKAWNRFRRYPTPDNMIAFNKARARARKIHRQRKRESWINYVSSITCSTSSKEVWNKIHKLSGKYSASPVSMLVSNGVSINTIPEIANTLAETLAKTSSCNNYTPAFQALKRREERVKLNFSSSNEEGYNSPLTLLELRVALHCSGNTAAGPDGLHYIMLWHLSKSSILSLLLLFNRIWETQVFPTQWCHAHVLPFPNPGKGPTSANNYLPNCPHKLLKQADGAHNLKIRRAKALNILKVLANTRWGADRTSLLRLYRALIRSKLDYGSVVYRSACKSLLKILDPVHHQDLRLCLGAFRTSPVESLYAEAYEPPLDLRRKYLCLNYFMNIQSMKTNTAYSYLFNFSLYNFKSHRSSLTYSQPFHFRIRDLIIDLNLNIGRIALCNISEMPPWKVIYPKVDFSLSCYSKACTPVSTYITLYLEHIELFSDYEPIFTDGSKSESHVGSAVVSLSTVITGALPISASIYTAELHALRIAIEHISLSRGKKFIIYTDSLSARQSIASLHSSSHPILVDIPYALANHLKKKDIRFCWIPGHAGITGNELDDTAARSATGSSERFPIPHSDLKACFRQKLQSVWQSNWDQQTEN
ncbi:probable RNA-directed DNA polymerase from transposon X-element [Trichonephila clavata]|uniref:Probable RNA-directed DNA polymerase from transposon X-element n=1 Tax=Trichonephila clavata TaxID=2740835 RepID=A0A8X6FCX7_TRICU|nr:probable RNA-directed DNA polymerase from transposon X-element [Trichonephila clavata]